MNKSLSDSEIRKLGIANVIQYEDLPQYEAEQLLSKLPICLLYQASRDYGHWTLLHRTPEGIEFFDSLGFKPDAQFQYLSYKQPHHIAKLLYELSKTHTINYSPYILQQDGPNINTCGRHVLCRHYFAHVGIDQYARTLLKVGQQLGLSPDELVTKMTSEV